jgi:hypothetical protein
MSALGGRTSVEPIPSDGQLFELPDEKLWFMKLRPGARAASAFLIALLVVAAIEIPIMLWPSAALTYSPILGFVFILAVMGFLVLLRLRRRITKVRISPEGLGVVDFNGKKSVQRWTDPSFGLTLMDHSKEPRASLAAKRNIELWANEADRGWVPPDLATRITEEARSRGLPVVVQEERISQGRYAGLAIPTTRIGRLESTPKHRSLLGVRTR